MNFEYPLLTSSYPHLPSSRFELSDCIRGGGGSCWLILVQEKLLNLTGLHLHFNSAAPLTRDAFFDGCFRSCCFLGFFQVPADLARRQMSLEGKYVEDAELSYVARERLRQVLVNTVRNAPRRVSAANASTNAAVA